MTQSVDLEVGISLRGVLPEIWISGGQMSGEGEDTGAGSSVQIYKEKIILTR